MHWFMDITTNGYLDLPLVYTFFKKPTWPKPYDSISFHAISWDAKLTAAGYVLWHSTRTERHSLLIVVLWRWCGGQWRC